MVAACPLACLHSYSQETDLVRRSRRSDALAQVRQVVRPTGSTPSCTRHSPAILVLDLRAKAHDLLEQIQAALPEILVVALEPCAQSRCDRSSIGVYAAGGFANHRRRLQRWCLRASIICGSARTVIFANTLDPPAPEPYFALNLSPSAAIHDAVFLRFPRSFAASDTSKPAREFVESVADAHGSAASGFFQDQQSDRTVCVPGCVACPRPTRSNTANANLVRWFELHAHIIAAPLPRWIPRSAP